MSELAREEILAVLEAWKKDFSRMQIWYEIDEEIYQAIRHLIENRPRVTRKFVIRKANEYSLPHFWLFQFVRELGIEIEEEKEA